MVGVVAGGGSGGSGNVALSGGGLGCNVSGIMIGYVPCLGIGGGEGFHILGYLGLRIDVKYVQL